MYQCLAMHPRSNFSQDVFIIANLDIHLPISVILFDGHVFRLLEHAGDRRMKFSVYPPVQASDGKHGIISRCQRQRFHDAPVTNKNLLICIDNVWYA